MVDVFLMGTFEGTKDFHLLSPALRHWVMTVYEHSHNTLTHAHASPTSNTDPSWLIPLVVTVPAGSLQEHGQAGHRAYIDQQSLDVLADIHRQMQKEFEFISQFDTIRELFSRILLADTRISSFMQKNSPMCSQPSSLAGYSQRSLWQSSCSSLGAAPASGDLRPASKRKRYDTPETSAPNYGAGRGGPSASSQRGTSHSRGRGTYQRQANGRSTPSLGYDSAGQQSIESLSSMSTRVSANSSSYWTAEFGTSGSSIRTGVSHEAVFQGRLWSS
ncbi:hypothetical protein EV714DRAFT_275358 [Schizophyllum commune]